MHVVENIRSARGNAGLRVFKLLGVKVRRYRWELLVVPKQTDSEVPRQSWKPTPPPKVFRAVSDEYRPSDDSEDYSE